MSKPQDPIATFDKLCDYLLRDAIEDLSRQPLPNDSLLDYARAAEVDALHAAALAFRAFKRARAARIALEIAADKETFKSQP